MVRHCLGTITARSVILNVNLFLTLMGIPKAASNSTSTALATAAGSNQFPSPVATTTTCAMKSLESGSGSRVHGSTSSIDHNQSLPPITPPSSVSQAPLSSASELKQRALGSVPHQRLWSNPKALHRATTQTDMMTSYLMPAIGQQHQPQ